MRSQLRQYAPSLGWLLASCCALFGSAPAQGAEADQPHIIARQKAYDTRIVPLLKKYCYDCHSNDAMAERGLAFDDYKKSTQIGTTGRKAWKLVHSKMTAGAMPPKGEPKPTPAEVQEILDWVDAAMNDYDCKGSPDPGKVTARRLNRTEYRNTIRDLVGVDFNPEDDFPSDESGYGFDNIGDVLTLPPLLMEKYLTAAEKIASQAIIADPKQLIAVKRFEGNQLRSPGSRGPQGRGSNKGPRFIGGTGEVFCQPKIARAGEYIIRIKTYGNQAGNEPCNMELKLNGKLLKSYKVKSEEDAPEEIEYKLNLPAGEPNITIGFTNDFYDEKEKDPKKRDRNLIIVWLDVQGPMSVKPEDYPASHKKLLSVMPGDGVTPAAAAHKVLRTLASRSFRRPVEDAELQKLLGLFDRAMKAGETYEGAIQLCLQALLVSPHFLFRMESDPVSMSLVETQTKMRQINEFELATRLSYFLWSTMPDDELFREAWQGTLRKNLDAQVQRMLKDEKSKTLADNFAMQWLELRNLDRVSPDRERFAAFSPELKEAMKTEALLLFQTVMKEDRSLIDLIAADYTFLNGPLAEFYGIKGPGGKKIEGSDFQRISTAGTPRGGILTMAGVLTITSNPNRTSPVKRGKWILENVLADPPPSAPPNVPQLAEGRRASDKASLRERMELHRRDPACASCHKVMDAMGFALENFDPIGAFRAKDGRFDIDPSAELPNGKKFTGAEELKKLLVAERSADYVRCVAEKMLTYALGRGLEYYDKCALDGISTTLAKNNHRFSTLVLEIVRSDPFQKRRLKNVE